jgi:methylmalonyl-CoA mutase N-terminal domain/subunit
VNEYVQPGEAPIETLYIDARAGEQQLSKLEALRKRRGGDHVGRALDRLGKAARTTENLMPPILDAVRAYATVGEMCDVLREVWGEYEEMPVI